MRYVFLNTTLAQIQALELRKVPEAMVREALKKSLQACKEMLQNYLDTAQIPEYSTLTSSLFNGGDNSVSLNDGFIYSLCM